MSLLKVLTLILVCSTSTKSENGLNADFVNDIVDFVAEFILQQNNCITFVRDIEKPGDMDDQILSPSILHYGPLKGIALRSLATLAETQVHCMVAIANLEQVRNICGSNFNFVNYFCREKKSYLNY